jgi:hypothetical protein
LENAFGLLEAKIAKGVEQYAGRDDEAEKIQSLFSRVHQQYVREVGSLCAALARFNSAEYDIEKMAQSYCSQKTRNAALDARAVVDKFAKSHEVIGGLKVLRGDDGNIIGVDQWKS